MTALPDLDPTTRTINRTVKALIANAEMTPDQFYARASISKGTYYNRLRGRGDWTAPELQRAAAALGVEVGVLFSGLSVAPNGPSMHEVTRRFAGNVIPLPTRPRIARSA